MPKQTKVKNSKRSSLDSIQKEQRKERKMMADMNAKERFMKWLLIAVVILLLLLILFAGYATDWLRGVKKDSSITPVSSSLDSAKTPNGTDTTTTTPGGGTNTNTGTTTGNTSRTATNGTSNTNDTSRASESSNTTTTTNNNTTTTNPTPPTTPPKPGLLNLYADSSVGDTISSILNNAQLLGLSKNCHNEILIQVCEVTDGVLTVTTKNLLGTGIVTSLTKNF